MDANKLRYYIADRGKNMASFEAELGISKTALYRKMNGKSEFTRAEIQRAILYLGLSEEETMSVFFNDAVS